MKKITGMLIVAALLAMANVSAFAKTETQKPQETQNQDIQNVETIIQQSETIEPVESQEIYLIEQAEMFYNSEQYETAKTIAVYILSNVNEESEKATDLLDVLAAKTENAEIPETITGEEAASGENSEAATDTEKATDS